MFCTGLAKFLPRAPERDLFSHIYLDLGTFGQKERSIQPKVIFVENSRPKKWGLWFEISTIKVLSVLNLDLL